LKNTKLLWLVCFLVSNYNLLCQADSINIRVVDIVADTPREQSNFSKSKEDPKNETRTLSNWLNEQSSAYVKSYGLGSLATLSIRGGNANQNLLLWNNIPVNNPMLGLSDISLVPISLFEDIEFEKGGQSTMHGSGAITGSLNLLNKKPQETKLHLISTIGSFGRRQFSAGANVVLPRLSSSTKVFLDHAKNDFTYKIGNQEEKKLTNSTINSKGISQTLSYDLSQKSFLQFNGWVQRTEREIPPVTTQTKNVAFQKDDLNRFSFKYNRTLLKGYVETQIAYLNETNNYVDSLSNIDSNNHFEKVYHTTRIKNQLSNIFSLSMKYEGTLINADTKFYTENKTQYLGAIVGRVEYNNGKNVVTVEGRKEWNNISNSPFSPAINWNYKWSKYIEGSVKISREFRSPTLNEILWRPGGNPNLQPEEGWNQEITGIFRVPSKGKLSIASYHRVINNWILWSSNDNTFVQADNLKKVRSYGLEVDAEYKIYSAVMTHQISGSYAYTISKNLVSLQQPMVVAGSQLIYTPYHKAILDYSLEYKEYSLHVNYGYTSNVFGINENLEDYHLTNLGIGKKLTMNKFTIQGFLQVQNLMDVDYRVIERRPMPRRHINLTLKFTLK